MLGQVPFGASPTWVSTDVANYSTGAAWTDLNRDGWMDLVIANGNDMARQHVVVYYNSGVGTLPTTPGWQSSDIDYHGHLSVGDVNNDDFPDVAVSVYIGTSGFAQKGRVKLYLNNGGTLSSSPSWVSKDSFYTFSCALGDADGDGDLDLAVAGGESYNHRPERNRIYFNVAGALDSLPGWQSSQASYSYDVGWADFDNDGDLDLVFANETAPNRLYMNYGDSIGTSPIWSSTDASQQANSLFASDVNNDGYIDLAISDNNQLGGTGKFKVYLNNQGVLNTIPAWLSSWSGYGSGITLADIDDDGDNDLVTGGWWQPCRIYSNQGGSFSTTPQWTSATGSVVEAIVFGDYDNDGLDTMNVQFTSNGSRKLFYLPRSPLQQMISVAVGSDTLAPGEFCYDLENGWVSLSTPPWAGVGIVAEAVFSRDLDFAVSNWDPTVGNYVFRNTLPPVAVFEEPLLPARPQLLQNYPNPFNPSTSFSFRISHAGFVTVRMFDVMGQLVEVLVSEEKDPGEYSVVWNAEQHSSGVYFCRLQVRGFTEIRKSLLVR